MGMYKPHDPYSTISSWVCLFPVLIKEEDSRKYRSLEKAHKLTSTWRLRDLEPVFSGCPWSPLMGGHGFSQQHNLPRLRYGCKSNRKARMTLSGQNSGLQSQVLHLTEAPEAL